MTPDDTSTDIIVESSTLRARLRRTDAAILRLESLVDDRVVSADGAVAEGFTLLVPLDGRRTNLVRSSEQDAPTWTVDETGAVARWASVRSEHGGAHDVGIEVRIGAVGPALRFEMRLDNRSAHHVEEVRFPWLGDVRPVAERPLQSFAPMYGAAVRRHLFPTFENNLGYFGLSRPTQVTDGPGNLTAPGTPFVLVEDGTCGLYLGLGGRAGAPVGWLAELHPGWSDAILQAVPREDVGAPEPTAVQVGAGHLPFVAPATVGELTPVAMVGYVGDWHAGVDVYRALSDGWQRPHAVAPEWAREPTAWLQLQVNAPDDDLRLTFAELPDVARRCAAHGVGTIQLVGWNDGGQDRNNPSHDADPRLGGPDALAEAIRRCQDLGVRVVLFTKFTWGDRSTTRFRDDLVRLAVKDPYGDYYVQTGYRYQTLAQLWDVNTRRLVPMCFAADEYLDVCVDEARKVVAAGADGLLFDECLHHLPAIACFDESHGHRRGYPVYAADNELIRRFRERLAFDPSFLVCGEAIYDDELEQYELSYFRTDDPGHLPVHRYLRPQLPMMTALTGFDDRIMVNQCLMYRYVISYEPYFFKGSLDDVPATVAYGRRMDAVRTRWRGWLWDGEFRDDVGLVVETLDGARHRPCAWFASAADGAPGVVVSNESVDETIEVTIRLDAWDGPLVWHLVDDEDGVLRDDAVLRIPPRSAAVAVPAISARRS